MTIALLPAQIENNPCLLNAKPESLSHPLPHIYTDAGSSATERFLEFFAANIRNKNTRRAYARQVMQFLSWCEENGAARLEQIRPMLVAAYIEQMQGVCRRSTRMNCGANCANTCEHA